MQRRTCGARRQNLLELCACGLAAEAALADRGRAECEACAGLRLAAALVARLATVAGLPAASLPAAGLCAAGLGVGVLGARAIGADEQCLTTTDMQWGCRLRGGCLPGERLPG